MDKKITVAIVVGLLLNVSVTLIAFGYLQNEVNQMKNEDSDLPVTPTEPEPTLEPEPEPIPEPEPEPIFTPETKPEPVPEPEQEPEQEPAPQELTEPEPSEPKPELVAPEANLNIDIIYKPEPSPHADAEVKGYIVNPNSLPVYDVSINVHFSIMEGSTGIITAIYSSNKMITIGTMSGNEVLPINENFVFVGGHSKVEIHGHSYTVEWKKSE